MMFYYIVYEIHLVAVKTQLNVAVIAVSTMAVESAKEELRTPSFFSS